MPELPEVENVRLGINRFLKCEGVSNCIQSIEYFRSDVRNKIPKKRIDTLLGQTLLPLERRGKYLIFPTAKGGLLNHLGMTGSWRLLVGQDYSRLKHDHLRITLGGNRELIFNDPRRFSIIDFVPFEDQKSVKWLKKLGLEPLSDSFNAKNVYKLLSEKTGCIKAALLDQTLIVGIGNIYASEILFKSGIAPKRLTSEVELEESKKIVVATRRILSEAIAKGGSTIRDYKNAEGKSGGYSHQFQVYGRDNLNCKKCGKKIKMDRIGGRSTYWCTHCQN